MRKRRPINIVGDDEGGGAGAAEEGQYYDENQDEDYQWLIAAFRKGKGKCRFGGGKGGKGAKGGKAGNDPNRRVKVVNHGKGRCPNWHGDH